MSIKEILQNAAERELDAGGAVSVQMLEQLRQHRAQQKWFFIAIEVITVLGIAACSYFLVNRPMSDGMVTTLAGVLGIGAGGGIEMMRRLWREWSQADLLLLLLSEASEAEVAAVRARLVDKL